MVALLSVEGACEARWTHPSTVTRCECFTGPVLANSPDRGATVVWLDANAGTVVARRILRNGRLGLRRTLGPGDYAAQPPAVSMTRSGTTVAVWYDSNGNLLGRRMTRGGKVGRLQWIAPPNRDEARGENVAGVATLGVDAAGVATIAWQRFVIEPDEPFPARYRSATIQVRRLNVKGELGPTMDVHLEIGLSFNPASAVAPDGDATVTWTNEIDDLCFPDAHTSCPVMLRASRISRSGAVGPALDVAALNDEGRDLVSDVHGNTTVVWGNNARRIGTDGTLGPINVLASQADLLSPRLGVDRAGNLTVIWENGLVGRFIANGTGGRSRSLVTLPCSDFGKADVAVDSAGNATVVWTGCASEVDGRPKYGVHAVRVTRDGVLGSPRTLAAFKIPYEQAAPDVVADGRGVVTVTWYHLRPYQPGEPPTGTIRIARFFPRHVR
jgi:YD repeat-containing protein